MTKNFRSLLLLTTAAGVLFAAAPAHADPSEEAQIKALQAQIKAMQKSLATLAAQKPAATTAASPTFVAPPAKGTTPSADQAATEAPAVESPATPSAAETSGTTGNKMQDAIYKATGAKITLGGYVEAAAIERSKNETADQISNFNTSLPFNNSVNAHQSEFRGTARGSRFSLLAEGKPDQNTNLIGYVETDFLGGAPTATSVETNSYTPRLRQGFVGYERNDWGFDVYAGQMWSLATLYKNGLTPRQEALPPTIDVALLPGYTYIRSPELRLVKQLDDNKVSVAFSAVSPQVNFGGITAPTTITETNLGQSSTFASTNAYSTDVAPDLISKVAFDPGYGHYEAFGMMRFFHDNVDSTLHNNVVIGGGGGVGTVLPVIKDKLSVQANGMLGQGIGRYGPALLPDFAITPNGAIKPLTEYMGSVGLVGHPTQTWDAYLFGGAEKVLNSNVAGGGTTFGYGNTGTSNAGCYVNNGTCNAQTSDVWQVTAGVWHDIYKGSYGDMKIGVQDSETRRDAFSDAAGNAPHAYENIVMTSFRYYPF